MMKKAKGFTLIELLVVIAIIGLLSTLAVVALNSARAKARDAKRVSDIKQIATSLELYYSDNSGYPGVGASAVNLGSGSYACLNISGFGIAGCTFAYMPVVPAQSATGLSTGAAYTYEGRTANNAGNCPTAPCAEYRIYFSTEATPTGLPTGCGAGPYTYKQLSSGISCQP